MLKMMQGFLAALCAATVISSAAHGQSDYERSLQENRDRNREATRATGYDPDHFTEQLDREQEQRQRASDRNEALANFDRIEALQKAFTRALDGHDIEAMRRARDALTDEQSRQTREMLLRRGRD